MEITEASFYLDSNFISTTSMIMKSLDCPTIEGVYEAAEEAAYTALSLADGDETNLEKDEDDETLYHLVQGVAPLIFTSLVQWIFKSINTFGRLQQTSSLLY